MSENVKTSPSEKARAASQIRYDLLDQIKNTGNLFELSGAIDNGLQEFRQHATDAETNAVSGEVFQGIEDRLKRDITGFDVKKRDTVSDPKWLIDIAGKMDGGFNKSVLKQRITLRLRDDILYTAHNYTPETMDYFYMLAGRLDVSLDDQSIESAVLIRAENNLRFVSGLDKSGTSMKRVNMICDFLDANLPVGPSHTRQKQETACVLDFNGFHYIYEV